MHCFARQTRAEAQAAPVAVVQIDLRYGSKEQGDLMVVVAPVMRFKCVCSRACGCVCLCVGGWWAWVCG